MTTKDIDVIKQGLIEFKYVDLTGTYYLYVKEGYVGKMAAILENEFQMRKHNGFRIYPNEKPAYLQVSGFSWQVALKFREIFEYHKFENYIEMPKEQEEPKEPKNYESYVIIAAAILFAIIVTS